MCRRLHSGETVDLRPCEHQQLDAASLCAVLPADAPAYLLYRWKHEREGEARAPALFVYCCPEESPVRAKMLHASTKAAALEHVAEAGVQASFGVLLGFRTAGGDWGWWFGGGDSA